MEKLLMFLIILILCSFFKKDTEVSVKAKELGDKYLDYININGIKGGYFYIDSLNRTHTLRNFKHKEI